MSPLQKQQLTRKQNTYQGLFSSDYSLFSAVWTNEVFTHCWLMLRWERSSIKSHLALKVKAAALTGKTFTQLHRPSTHTQTHTRTYARRQSGFRSAAVTPKNVPMSEEVRMRLMFLSHYCPNETKHEMLVVKEHTCLFSHTHTITTIT